MSRRRYDDDDGNRDNPRGEQPVWYSAPRRIPAPSSAHIWGRGPTPSARTKPSVSFAPFSPSLSSSSPASSISSAAGASRDMDIKNARDAAFGSGSGSPSDSKRSSSSAVSSSRLPYSEGGRSLERESLSSSEYRPHPERGKWSQIMRKRMIGRGSRPMSSRSPLPGFEPRDNNNGGVMEGDSGSDYDDDGSENANEDLIREVLAENDKTNQENEHLMGVLRSVKTGHLHDKDRMRKQAVQIDALNRGLRVVEDENRRLRNELKHMASEWTRLKELYTRTLSSPPPPSSSSSSAMSLSLPLASSHPPMTATPVYPHPQAVAPTQPTRTLVGGTSAGAGAGVGAPMLPMRSHTTGSAAAPMRPTTTYSGPTGSPMSLYSYPATTTTTHMPGGNRPPYPYFYSASPTTTTGAAGAGQSPSQTRTFVPGGAQAPQSIVYSHARPPPLAPYYHPASPSVPQQYQYQYPHQYPPPPPHHPQAFWQQPSSYYYPQHAPHAVSDPSHPSSYPLSYAGHPGGASGAEFAGSSLMDATGSVSASSASQTDPSAMASGAQQYAEGFTGMGFPSVPTTTRTFGERVERSKSRDLPAIKADAVLNDAIVAGIKGGFYKCVTSKTGNARWVKQDVSGRPTFDAVFQIDGDDGPPVTIKCVHLPS